jgi:hypothetical protein
MNVIVHDGIREQMLGTLKQILKQPLESPQPQLVNLETAADQGRGRCDVNNRQAIKLQPAIKATPPNGVIAPSHLVPVSTST